MTDAIPRQPLTTAQEGVKVPEVFIHIHAPQPDIRECVVMRCPTCERMRRFYATHTPWYGWDVWCAGCGEHGQDGEWLPRPFRPGWRKHNREYARKMLAQIGIPA